MKPELYMKPPVFAQEMIRNLESQLMWARTAPYYMQTMRPGDTAYEMTERLLNKIKNEVLVDSLPINHI